MKAASWKNEAACLGLKSFLNFLGLDVSILFMPGDVNRPLQDYLAFFQAWQVVLHSITYVSDTSYNIKEWYF